MAPCIFAVRAGVITVLLPEKNREDLFDVPQTVKDALRIVYVSTADEVLAEALAVKPNWLPNTIPVREEAAHGAVRH